MNGRTGVALAAAICAAITFVAFIPALGNDFVDWDDTGVLLENESYRGLGPEQLRWMFTTAHYGHYQPITWLTYGLDYVLWGMRPVGYHLTSSLFHALNAALVLLLARRLLRRATGAGGLPLLIASATVALFFGLHPLRVESVAWATERRDLVSAFFILLALLAYLRSAPAHDAPDGRTHLGWLAAALGLYVLSMISKVGGAPLPVVLLVLDAYPLRRIPPAAGRRFDGAVVRVLLEKVPFFVVALGFSYAVVQMQQDRWLIPWDVHDFTSRTVQAFYGLAFYAWKTVWPIGLSPLYELRAPLDPFAPVHIAAVLFVLAVAAAATALVRRVPAVLAAALCYAAMLGPLLGYFQNGPQTVADRYSYLSTLGLPLLAAGGLLVLHLRGRLIPAARTPALIAVGAVLLGLGTLTWIQCSVWQSTKTLWTHMIELDPDSSFANNSFGYVLLSEGRAEESLSFFRTSIGVDPANEQAWFNLWNALEALGRGIELEQSYREALEAPDGLVRVPALFRLGNAALAARDYRTAAERFRGVVQMRDDHAGAHLNLGIALANDGRFAEAVPHYERAIEIGERPIDARLGFAAVLERLNQRDRALAVVREVLAAEPENERARRLLTRLGG